VEFPIEILSDLLEVATGLACQTDTAPASHIKSVIGWYWFFNLFF